MAFKATPPRGVEPTTLSDRLAQQLAAGWFFAAMLAGFLAASALGWLLAGSVTYEPFVRFHQFISAEAYFFPTATQVERMIAATPPSKILVIIGGSSRLNGAGQRPVALWSRELADMLGDRYHVLNLAVRGGGFDQIGNHAAEFAIRLGRETVLVADILRYEPLRASGFFPAYRYFYFDARARGLLLAWPPREEALARDALQPAGMAEDPAYERRLRAMLNRYMWFDDLWTTVGYQYVFVPSWYVNALHSPFRARRRFDDAELNAPSGGYRYVDFDRAMRVVRSVAQPFDEPQVQATARSLSVLPADVLRRTIVVSIVWSPYFTRHFDASELEGLRVQLRQRREIFSAAGIPVVELADGLTQEDFVDHAHLSEAGGRRLARIVAPAVRQLSERLGYDPGRAPARAPPVPSTPRNHAQH